MDVVLAANDHFAFSSSTWSSWADSPHDLQLVTKDGALVGAHRGILLPLSQHLGGLVQATGCCATAQLILPDTSLAAASAVKDLLYRGCCQLDNLVTLPEVLETLSLLGVNVMNSNFVVEANAGHMEEALPKVSALEEPSGLVNRPLDRANLENVQEKHSDNSSEALMTGSRSLVEGMVFPNYEEVLAYIRQWSLANLSPVTNQGKSKTRSAHNGFRCPHACVRNKSRSTGRGLY